MKIQLPFGDPDTLRKRHVLYRDRTDAELAAILTALSRFVETGDNSILSWISQQLKRG